VSVASESIDTLHLRGSNLDAKVAVTVEIRNDNIYPLKVDPMELTVAFPEVPDNILATGTIELGTLPKRTSVSRGVTLDFSTSISNLGELPS